MSSEPSDEQEVDSIVFVVGQSLAGPFSSIGPSSLGLPSLELSLVGFSLVKLSSKGASSLGIFLVESSLEK